MAVACLDIEVRAGGSDRPEDVLGEGTAVGAEVPDQDAASLLQAVEKPLQCFGLMLVLPSRFSTPTMSPPTDATPGK